MVKRAGTVSLCLIVFVWASSEVAGATVSPHLARATRSHVAAKLCGARRQRRRCVRRPAAHRILARAAAVKKTRRRPAKPAAPKQTVPVSSGSAPSTSGSSGSASGSSAGSASGPSGSTGGTSGSTTGSGTSGSPGAAPQSDSGTSWSSFGPHVETWAYDDCANGGSSASASAAVVRAWVTYAEANCGPAGDAKTLSDCHSGSAVFCDVIQYLDTNWIYQEGSPPWTLFEQAAGEDWYQHTPGSSTSRIESNGYGGGALIDQANPAVRSWFQSYARGNYDGVDGLMMDDQSGGLSTQLYYSTCGCGSSSEVGSDAALRAAHEAMSAALTHSDGRPFLQVDNTLPVNPYLPQGLDMLDHSIGVDGLIAEGEPEYDGTLDPYYSTLLDQIAYVADAPNAFVVPLSYGQAGASYQAQSRRVQEATVLLGYSPGHLVDWANLETGSSDLAVWPEEGIYPTEPVQSMGVPGGSGCLAGTGQVCSIGGHVSLEVAPGVYRREFGACYDRGVAFGACAAIVNTTSSPVTVKASWLTQTYTHQITTSGGDVQSGGTITTVGAGFTPTSTTVAPDDATLLAGH